jgi:diguanylate cyclase (GGDEF)-like protein/putative nucleotidyltransferase with HDIG domain
MTETRQRYPMAATLLQVAVGVATVAIIVAAILSLDASREDWTTFVVLSAATAAAQLFVVKAPPNQSYHTSIAFLIPAVLLLPWQLVVLVPLVQHAPEQWRKRYPWYIQAFNVGNYTIDLLCAWLVADAVRSSGDGGLGVRFALAGLLASIVFVLLNHGLLQAILTTARGHSFRQSGLFGLESVSTDLILALLGLPVAALWLVNGWLVPAAVAPLILIRRSLAVPALEEKIRVDPKTGLFNSRHFAEQLEDELARALRFERPLAVIMSDLDLLRDINNTHGHLAGDAVLQRIADTIRATVRSYDVAARFGGEEFAILLPETTAGEAFEIAERIRRALAGQAIEVPTAEKQIRATISCGVAAFPADGDTSTKLLHEADLAVYRAKAQGRNRVIAAGSEAEIVADGRTPQVIVTHAEPPATETPSRRLRLVGPARRRAGSALEEGAAALERANVLLRARSTAAVENMAATLEARDPHTVGHARRVRAFALAIAAELRLRDESVEALGHAALLHDVGKLSIPDSILLKPGPLSEPEWDTMRAHASDGARIVERLGFLGEAIPAIEHHHERFDGAGYPARLAGEQIPLTARIVHVADALDTMLANRAYRPARSLPEALGELRAGAGTQFCPTVVGALERVLSRTDVDLLTAEESRQPARASAV